MRSDRKSNLDSKTHPHKLFRVVERRLRFFSDKGAGVKARQSLEPLYSRNGLCYCYQRETLLTKQALITDNTVSVITERPVANVDEPLDLLWAEFLLERAEQVVVDSSGLSDSSRVTFASTATSPSYSEVHRRGTHGQA